MFGPASRSETLAAEEGNSFLASLPSQQLRPPRAGGGHPSLIFGSSPFSPCICSLSSCVCLLPKRGASANGPMKAALFWVSLGLALSFTPFRENVTLPSPCSERPFWVRWGTGEGCGGGRRGGPRHSFCFLGSQGPVLGYVTWRPVLPRREERPGAPFPHSTGYFWSSSCGLSCFHPSLPRCRCACALRPECGSASAAAPGGRPRPPYLHDAVALRDILRDTGLIAALQKDGPVVIHIQDSDEHGGRACAALAYGAIVCGR